MKGLYLSPKALRKLIQAIFSFQQQERLSCSSLRKSPKNCFPPPKRRVLNPSGLPSGIKETSNKQEKTKKRRINVGLPIFNHRRHQNNQHTHNRLETEGSQTMTKTQTITNQLKDFMIETVKKQKPETAKQLMVFHGQIREHLNSKTPLRQPSKNTS